MGRGVGGGGGGGERGKDDLVKNMKEGRLSNGLVGL